MWDGFVGIFESLLVWLNSWIGNYAVAIMFFSIIVKLITMPFDIKSKKSMAKMNTLQPEINVLNEKYKNDKDKLSKKTMELYKKNNVNPLSGCLPSLIQMPIFFAIFQALRKVAEGMSTDKVIEPFMWIKNIWVADSLLMSTMGEKLDFASVSGIGEQISMALSQGNGLFILSVLAGITSYISFKVNQKNTPKKSNNNMQFMNYLFPVMSVWFTAMYTASFGIYWVMSNILMIAYTLVINQHLAKEKDKKLEDGAVK